MSYMGDRRSSKSPQLHVIKHIRLAMGSPEEVKDEAYLQVIKQITRNPNPESAYYSINDEKAKYFTIKYATISQSYDWSNSWEQGWNNNEKD